MVDFRIIGNSSPTGTPQSTGLLEPPVQKLVASKMKQIPPSL